ncbi:MAG TPA: hypothetical protein VK178_08160 [Opitutaceae bacterium]|nr:hypothetical protein [Opitutaceae bacterium]
MPNRSVVFTLLEGHYHLGAAVLFNSLHAAGFRGKCIIGHRGPPPPWCTARSPEGRPRWDGPDGFHVECVAVDTEWHLTNHKPAFFQRLWREIVPAAERLFYLDPDVVVKREWLYFEDWADCGVALVEDVNPVMPNDHPVRQAWARFLRSAGFPPAQTRNAYYNGGFVGVHRRDASFVELWHRLIEAGQSAGFTPQTASQRMKQYPYFRFADQDFLNMATMVSPLGLSTVGPSGMDFFPGGTQLSHAMGRPKPWLRFYLGRAFSGIPLAAADRFFWAHAAGPIPAFSAGRVRWKKLDLAAASFLNRFYCRA